jgi:RNA polymerase sporulation-specific sigma factor
MMLRIESSVEKIPSPPVFRPSEVTIPRNGKSATSGTVPLAFSHFPPLLSQEIQDHCLLLNACGDQEARRCLILSNLRLVTLATRRFKHSNDYEDLVSAGVIALIMAVDAFRQNGGSAFSTFALTCIKNAIANFLKKKSLRLNEVSLESVLWGRDASNGYGKRLTMAEVLATENNDNGHGSGPFPKALFLSRMRESMAFLSARERLVLNLRFGLKEKREMTQQEAAKAMGVDRSRISRIEKSALEKMRELMGLPPDAVSPL